MVSEAPKAAPARLGADRVRMELEHRVDRIEEALARLVEAQARTEAAVRALAEAQARTEARLDRVEAALARLAEAQARTEARVGELAQAQARTEVAVRSLTQQVGRLSDTIGFTLEDLAREMTPAYLAQHYGIRGLELERRFFVVDGQELEVDFYGEGRRDGEAVAVVGEVRSRIYGQDVEGAVRQAARLAPTLPARPIVVLFGSCSIRPRVRLRSDPVRSSSRPRGGRVCGQPAARRQAYAEVDG